MTDTLTIHATTREEKGRKMMAKLREKNMIPAVVYGNGVENRSLAMDRNPFEKVYAQAGESSLINLSIDNAEPVKVIIQSIQRDPIGYTIDHVDFHQVKMDEKIHAEVELVFENEAPAVKELGGILIKSLTHVQIESLPGDLPHHIVVDVSSLKTFEDTIRIKDLPVSQGVTILHEGEDAVAAVSEPRSEAELEALNEAVVENVAAVEVTTEKADKEAKEGEEAAADKKA